MTVRTGLIPSQPAGAGATYDVWWPGVAQQMTVGDQVGTGLTRQGTSTLGLVGFIQVATGTAQVARYLGTSAYRLRSAAAGDRAELQGGTFINVPIEQLPASLGPMPMQCWRLIAVCAFPLLAGPLNPATADLGLELLPGNVDSMNQGANRPGIMFGPTDNGVFSLRARPGFGPAYTVNTPVPAGQTPSLADYNMYELRIIGASNAGPAQLKVFINSRQVLPAVLFGVGAGLLPSENASGGGFNSYRFYVTNSPSGILDCYVKSMHWVAGPTEQSTL
jgi:hypothetical protein